MRSSSDIAVSGYNLRDFISRKIISRITSVFSVRHFSIREVSSILWYIVSCWLGVGGVSTTVSGATVVGATVSITVSITVLGATVLTTGCLLEIVGLVILLGRFAFIIDGCVCGGACV